MNREDCVELGYVLKAHGLHGEVRTVWDVSNIADYKRRKELWLSRPRSENPPADEPLTRFAVAKFKATAPNEALIKFEGYSTMAEARALQGCTLFFPIEQLPQLTNGQFYIFQIVGFTVVDSKLGALGTVVGVEELPHHDILIMNYRDKEVLIPYTDLFVGRPDMEARTLPVSLPDGLLEVYLGDTTETEEEAEAAESAAAAE